MLKKNYFSSIKNTRNTSKNHCQTHSKSIWSKPKKIPWYGTNKEHFVLFYY